MKIPLKYQSAEYDCVPTTFMNGLNYLLDRDKIEPMVIKTIMAYSLDSFDKKGAFGKGGTSKMAVRLLTKWLDEYSETINLGIKLEYLMGEEIELDRNRIIEQCIGEGGVFLPCICLKNSVFHYVLVTDMDQSNVYFFDPYAIEGQYESRDIEVIRDMPFKMNRRVKRERFNSHENIIYSLGKLEKREGILIHKKNLHK